MLDVIDEAQQRFEAWIDEVDCKFMGKQFRPFLCYVGGRFYLQVMVELPNNDTPHDRTEHLQSGRKWMLSPHMTKSEFVGTCFKAAMTFIEHEMRECFTYKGARIYGPHLDVEALRLIATAEMIDARKEAA